jgi:hypothetical protein
MGSTRTRLDGESLGPAVAGESGRGLDRGAYAPLVAMYPEADSPIPAFELRRRKGGIAVLDTSRCEAR